MKNLYNTLVVGQRGLIIKGVSTVLNEITQSTGVIFVRSLATNNFDAIRRLKISPPIELVFLEISQSKERSIKGFFGEELGVDIRKLYPNVLIVVIMARLIPIQIKSIHYKVKPDGFFVLGDIDHLDIASAYKKVLNEPPFYSQPIAQALLDFETMNFNLEEIDIQLLRELDKGNTLKKIGELILLSQPGVSKRKRKLKKLFGVPEGNDRDLVDRAKVLGII